MNDLLFGSPEFRLVAACCRWPRSEVRDAAVRTACVDVVDWNRLLWLVERHRVAGLVHDALSSSGDRVPDPVIKRLAAAARRMARSNLVRASESIRLHRLFDAAGIPSMTVKGIALAQLAYGSLSIKHTRDIDMLVPPDHALQALQVLEAEGYVLCSPARDLGPAQRRALVRYAREVEVVQPGTGVHVELQWRLTGNGNLLKGIDARSPTQTVGLPDGTAIPTLTDEDLFAFLCVHGAHHLWSRLKWLVDLNAFVVRSGGADAVARYYRHAQDRGAGLCAGQALLLCRDLLQSPLPADLEAELAGDKRLPALVSVALQALADPVPDSVPGRDVGRVVRGAAVQYLYGRGWRFLLAQLRAQLVGAGDIVQLPLPGALQFLYPLVRLPLWLGRRLVWLVTAHPSAKRP